jgi:endonuclease/exonuclease/phosphatase family metal-dependent hydrolase
VGPRTDHNAAGNSFKASLFFSLLLLFFVQSLTLWVESIYRIGLTKLGLGTEAFGLLFVLSPLCVLLCPESAQHRLLSGAVVVSLLGRAMLPLVGVSAAVVIAGSSVGAFLVVLCMLLSRSFRFLRGDGGIALGLALLMSIALRAWGATNDITLGKPGAVLGWMMVGLALGLYWHLSRTVEADPCPDRLPERSTLGPMLGLFASLTMAYLVLSSPGVVETWLGFDNTWGTTVCILALGSAVILLGWGLGFPRAVLFVWSSLFALALVGGILALWISFPATPSSPAVLVPLGNTAAEVLLGLMFLLSPVVLFNARAACRSVGEFARARSLAVPVFLGITLLVLLTIMSIFANVWGYVGPVSASFRNQFHLPFLLACLLMLGALCLPRWRAGSFHLQRLPANRWLEGLTVVLSLCALGGAWYYRPVAATAAPAKPKTLTILTYNLQQGSALDGNRNWENQLALVRKINADVIGLQESDTARPSDGHVAAVKYFGARLGYHIYYGPNTVSGTYGTAILSRFPLKNPRSFFTFSDEDEVGTAVAEFELGGKTFAFFSSHPSGRVPKRCHAEELIRQAKPYNDVIAVGDYNATPKAESYRILTAHFKDSWVEVHPDAVGRLHAVLRPRGAIRPHGSSGQIAASGDTIAMPERIDHIFLSKPLKVLESYYLPAPASETDHPAHWAVVAWD